MYDSGGDGWLTENDLQQYVEDLLPRLPALTGLLDAFVHFYKVHCAAPRGEPRHADPRDQPRAARAPRPPCRRRR